MNPKLSDLILRSSFTQNEAIRKLTVLKDYLSSKIFGSEVTQSKWSELLLEENRAWFTGLDSAFLEQINAQNMETVFQEALSEIKKIEVLTIFTAIELPEEEVSAVAVYLRQTYGPNFLIDVSIDPNIIAGAVLTWKGVQKDYSLRQKINQNRKQILGLLAQYVGSSHQ